MFLWGIFICESINIFIKHRLDVCPCDVDRSEGGEDRGMILPCAFPSHSQTPSGICLALISLQIHVIFLFLHGNVGGTHPFGLNKCVAGTMMCLGWILYWNFHVQV